MKKSTPEGKKFSLDLARLNMLPIDGVSDVRKPSTWRLCRTCKDECLCPKSKLTGANESVFFEAEMLKELMMKKGIKFESLVDKWHATIDHSVIRVQFMMSGNFAEGCEVLKEKNESKNAISTIKPRGRLPQKLRQKEKVLRLMASEQDYRGSIDGIQYEKWAVVAKENDEDPGWLLKNAPASFWENQSFCQVDPGAISDKGSLLDGLFNNKGICISSDVEKIIEVILEYRRAIVNASGILQEEVVMIERKIEIFIDNKVTHAHSANIEQFSNEFFFLGSGGWKST